MSTRILAEMVEHERESLAEYEARVRNAQADVEAQRARLRRREAALAAALDEERPASGQCDTWIDTDAHAPREEQSS